MATPYLGQISIMSFAFPPRGWAKCDGALLPIVQNQALFALLGTMYGGNGQVNFALPDLRGRTPVHRSATEIQGQALGDEAVTLATAQMPAHSHALNAVAEPAQINLPSAALPAARVPGGPALFGTINEVRPIPMAGSAMGNGAGGSAHENMPPFTTLNFVIALQGIFPTRN